MRWPFIAMVAAMLPAPALADSISVSKSAQMVSDPLGNAIPRSIPGALVDYSTTLANPVSNIGKTVRGIQYEEWLAPNLMLRVRDLGAVGSGPVAFTNGAIILGIGDSGLTYDFAGLGAASDSIEFSNGSGWTYTPVPDADGFDANVRAIRIKPVTTFKTGGSFTIRYRVKLR